MMQYDVVIVGGGISGLSMAFYSAGAGMKTMLLEKNETAGGSFASYEYTMGNKSFWLELGAHTCYSSYASLLGIVEACGMMGEMIPRAKVPFTFLKNEKIHSIVSQLHIAELLMSVPNLFKLKKDGRSVRSYYEKIVGKRNYDEVIRHFFNAVPSQPSDDFPADMMFKSREKRKDVLKNYTFKGGLQSVARAITKQPGIEVKTGSDVVSITRENDGYRLKTASGEEYSAARVALAVPSAVASTLLANVSPDLSAHLGKLRAAEVDTVGVIVRSANVSMKPVAAVISPDDLFFSVVSRDTVPDEHFRGFAFHFQPGVSEKKKKERITEVLGLPMGKIEHIALKANVVPSLRLGHHEWLAKTDSILKSEKGILLTGNYFAGMAIEDCVSRSKSESERLKG
ncbi:FAD-dependent oxidoreductase [Chlorobium phaeovibrioides]|uniref:FAD-dependent oxidoreductase n=2 Tax=Chlorobium phaeovibrioides TaxID=1094 RepID=A0A3S0NI91_CHLPH|nr:FAD-dependent oxidoreductase [Chlorobium phaeovibrioides]HCD36681.1 FAD-dependent oxidoreductase [Chlorobium sp.]KAA6231993.1 FAD-dependent oxidoreductase [Chlorobium phaeovibrioides]MWV54800.1 NAD(P)-binding protein [Chlorobium phaeovibrioides]QEQ57459.1 FAD-dependent oxidoreductase [Chlorobium phaeovibrioides]RTY35952.1 FAD-dependent oxidoreductase [Chlorobium phaeovibrioides]